MIEVHLGRLIGERKGNNVARLARDAGLAYSTVYELYRGQAKRLDLETLARLCEALDCQPGDILEYRAKGVRRCPPLTRPPRDGSRRSSAGLRFT